MSASELAIYLSALVAALTAYLVHYHIRAFSFWSSRGVKGPTPWPIFGTNIYYILKDKIQVDKEWRQKYGHTYGLYEGYYPNLRTTDNKLLKEVYIKNFSSFTDRHGRYIHGDIQQNWLLWTKGAKWANQRVLVSPMFSSAKMRLIFHKMTSCVDNFLHMVGNRIGQQTSASEDRPVTKISKRDVSSLTLDVIASCFFSLKLNTYEAEQNEFLKRAYAIGEVDFSWFLIWLIIPNFIARRLGINLVRQSKIQYLDMLSKQFVDERRRSETKKNDIIQAFIDAKLPDTYEQIYNKDDDAEAHYNDQISHNELENQQLDQTKQAKLFKSFTDIEIKGQMVFLLLAGFETTATTINFCLFELAHNPRVQEQLLDELRANFGASNVEAGLTNLTKESYSELLELKLLEAFVSEVLRLYSPLVEHNRIVTRPEGLELPISDDNTIQLPKGTPISTNGFILQRDGDYHERPDELDITRFLPENRHKLKTCTFMPFGLGPRHCVGMRFALLEVRLALAKIISRYVIAPGPDNKQYPAKLRPNAVFLQLQHNDVKMMPRLAQMACC